MRRQAVRAVVSERADKAWMLNTLFALTIAVLSVPPLYLVKSALGIDLMPGPSPLHDLLYWMVR